ncbi:ABC transporter ATP-binding protein [Flavihumibacter profundi]|jgi:Cu-processing system ATP-binding protein|uniref:ABC transporter ATP-binding protein n=1 Tax=Flavihumibacter profundi TaxID=2716883 RepID=UPI001CC41042|nr:ABC transporter ATP-binding protein [Flavihumibacter profundi]MBZ5857108.1 ABC transporter ATP-binding protein [Flavihumibacter profundi]
MIIATNVNKRFGKLQALDNVSLNCNKGQTIALIGPNGSGKTTFIKCLLGMVIPDSGFITVNNKNISHDWHYRKQIGYMPQMSRFPENMTIEQVIDMVKDIRSDANESMDEELPEAFGLKALYGKRMRTLSGGTRQKVSACLAFLFNPDILILDEPTAGLDPVSSEILKEKIISEKSKGKLTLITSHVLSDLDDLVTEVVYMQDGKLRFHSPLTKLQKETGEEKLNKVIARIMQNQ